MNKWILYACFLAVACQNPRDNYESLLKKAGPNRAELEKVLSHYRKNPSDSLKLKSAIFLIENMEDKFSYSGEAMNRFFHFCDSISGYVKSPLEYNKALIGYLEKNHTLVGQPAIVNDLETIRAEFLIRNIDDAFLSLEQSAWKDSVSFGDFCEYILPYRIGHAPLEDFREELCRRYAPSGIDRLTMRALADSVLGRTSRKGMFLATYPGFVTDYPVSLLQKLKGGSCVESSSLAVYIMRSLGLPVAQDFTPQWPHRSSGHAWCALIVRPDSSVDFEGINAKSIGGHLLLGKTNKIARIYRNTFGKQPESLAMIHNNEEIPEVFQNPYMKDVSSSYFKGAEVRMDLRVKKAAPGNHAYLCVFDNTNWVPIAWTAINSGLAVFPGMGKSIVYLPALYKGGQIQGVGNPLKVDSDGIVTPLAADYKNLQTLVLKRKYPVFDWWDSRTLAMKGGRFQASNRKDFSDAVDIYTIREAPDMSYQKIEVDKHGKFSYWRYLAADSSYGDIAEIQFLDKQHKIVRGLPIGSQPADSENAAGAAFDNDPLTFFQGLMGDHNWVGLKFEAPTRIDRIKFLCRNDDNFINSTDTYELYYWENGSWKSMGVKKGDDSQRLVYPGAPAHALFLLRDHSKGKEERIFTYENGKQVWW